ncbi:polysaccharide deacetylase family protein [Lysinibacillus sp. SGAir0095]|uniref:polysaccharide deacetylase family protein n=1 Tax=Lysinibacillus sp. SGAir0095 TaxID=2070463 RepID=UPI0010CD2D6F|nr:polysaccharide deacetylase family protein [Lysinibacillus sp. SGAir0095]QCR32282.1 hypothetical protein C1N55_08885 [Lysinibacillus sp. SGAir0095]
MKRNNFRYLIVFSSILVMTFGFYTPSSKAIFLDYNMKGSITTSSKLSKDELFREIEKFSEENNFDPIDAKIDPIWKAIPGYNGQVVDIKASYLKMKANDKFDETKIVYKAVAPKIHLNDLGTQPIYRGNPHKPMVAFLINVAWGNEYIPGILEVLDKHQTKATFFFDGSWVKKNPSVAKKIKDAGHEIGNHAYSHPDLQQRSKAETREELEKTNQVIEDTLNIKPKWFAPPSGSFNETTIQVAEQLQMKTILWTVDTVDWKKPAASEMVSRVVSKVENGSMILMHPTKPVAEGMEDMITNIKSKGYKLGTVTELMSEKRIN